MTTTIRHYPTRIFDKQYVKSITDANNVTADTFSHASSTQREDANKIFTSENLDKLDKIVDSVKNLTINCA